MCLDLPNLPRPQNVNCHGWLRTGLTGLLLLVELPVLAGPF
jgi:hypothetical protein